MSVGINNLIDLKPLVEINAEFQKQLGTVVSGAISIADDTFYNLQCFGINVISTAQIGITVSGLIILIYVLLFPEQIFPSINKTLDVAARLGAAVKPNISLLAGGY